MQNAGRLTKPTRICNVHLCECPNIFSFYDKRLKMVTQDRIICILAAAMTAALRPRAGRHGLVLQGRANTALLSKNMQAA